MRKIGKWGIAAAVLLALNIGCSSGGGGGDDSSSDNGQSDDGSSSDNGGQTAADGVTRYAVQAPVAQDGCGFRISPVTQTFTVTSSGGNISVDDGVIVLAGAQTADGFTAGFDEANGDCVRHYEAEFSNVSSTGATVNLSSRSTCSGVTCENLWAGTAVATN